MHVRNDYWMRERECERIFAAGGPYYMITTEHLDWLLYKTREEFERMIADGLLLEYAVYNDDYYGLKLRHLLQFSFVVAFVILILFFICSL